MSQAGIRYLLESRLAAWAIARDIRVAFENIQFQPDAGETYLRCFLLPAETDSLDLEGAHRLFQGLLQINVVAPLGEGPVGAARIADELAELFPLNLAMTADGLVVHVRTPVSIATGIQAGSTYTVPTRFTYRADVT